MKRWAWLLAFLGIAVLVVVLVLVAGGAKTPAASSGDPGTRSPATFVGVNTCKLCHTDTYNEWRGTAHGQDFTQFPYSGHIINKITYAGGSCAGCHTVGYNDTAQGGYDKAQAWNSTHNSELLGIQCENCHGAGSDHVGSHNASDIHGQPTVQQSCYGTAGGGCHGPQWSGHYNGWGESLHNQSLTPAGGMVATNPACQPCHTREAFINTIEGTSKPVTNPNPIDCALCHDPHNKTYEKQLRLPAGELCGQCHNNGKGPAAPGPNATVHHPEWEMNAGYGGANVTLSAGMAGVECVDCHMYQTPSVARTLITKFIGGEPHSSHWFTPTAEACVSCHDPDIMASLPTAAKPSTKPPSSDTANYTLWMQWESWGALYKGEVAKYQGVIDSWQEQTDARWAEADAKVEAARLSIVAANATGNVSAKALNDAWALYYDARWNLNFVKEDGSRGVHNIDYAMDLISDAEAKARQVAPLLVSTVTPPPPPPQPVPFDPMPLYLVIGLLGIILLVLAAMIVMMRSRLPPREKPKPETEKKE